MNREEPILFVINFFILQAWSPKYSFAGSPSSADLQQKSTSLVNSALAEGSRPESEDWICARYNKKGLFSAKGPFRRNDLLIPLEEASVDLWRGVDWDFIRRIVAHPV